MKTITQKAEFPEKYIRSVKWIDPKDVGASLEMKALFNFEKL